MLFTSSRAALLALGLALSVAASAQPSVPASVLRTGRWWRVAVSEAGLYRLDAAFLQGLGINTATLDPRTLKVYGNAQGLLPQQVNVPRIDDLRENAIMVQGESDGRFDAADAVYFYAEGPHRWRQRPDGSFYYELHPYADEAVYFLTIDQGAGLRVTALTPLTSPTETLTSGPQFAVLEPEQENLLHSGRQWFGDRFETLTQRDYAFATGAATGPGTARVRLAARSGSSTNYTLTAEGQSLGLVFVPGVPVNSFDSDYAAQGEATFSLPQSLFSDGNLGLRVAYNRPANATGWLDFIQLQWPALWSASGTSYFFQATATPARNAATFAVSTPITDYTVWDVSEPTRPRLQPTTFSSGTLSLVTTRDTLRRFLAWQPAAARTPRALGAVANQNLHALGATDYVIVVPEAWRAEADRLAAMHQTRYGRRTAIVTPEQCYNEFSSGIKDVTAIRDLMAMLWHRAPSAADRPKYLLLFGDGSYDARNRLSGRGDFVPVYESRQSLSRTTTYVSDDFFGFLESTEGFFGEGTAIYEGDNAVQFHTLDIAVGRLPARTLAEARILADKSIRYATAATPGDWRRLITFLGDYKQGEGSLHTSQSDSLARMASRALPCARLEKIYLDQYPSSTVGGGLTFPDARTAISSRIDQGSLIVNYTGHGSETVLSNARVVQIADAEGATNGGRLPFWITATCEFGRWDDPSISTGAEELLVNDGGGAIGLLTAVRLVFSFPNFVFNRNWYDQVFTRDASGNYRTLGEVNRLTKNATWASAAINTRNFCLLADPGITLALPTLEAKILEINGSPIQPTDTLRALQAVTLRGQVQNASGTLQADYNGQIRITLFDKALPQRTLLSGMSYQTFRTVLFNGSASVVNGSFEIAFVIPLDINYSFGPGNLQLYAEGTSGDALGCWRSLTVGGTDPDANTSSTPPTVELFLNDYSWRSGDLTGPEPVLLARVADDQGINAAGLGVGRELLAIVDGDERFATVLNNSYTADPDNAKRGTIVQRLSGISDGEHVLTIRVWDVANNPAEASTRFFVTSDASLAAHELLLYPNPLLGGELPQLELRHNRGSRSLRADITVVSSAGVPLARAQFLSTAEGRLVAPSDALEPLRTLAAGLYVMELLVTDTADGQALRRSSRIVLLR